MTIEKYISEWDPVSLIDDGYPEDEYSSEAFEIRFRYRATMSEIEVAELVHKVFLERLGLNPPGFENQCKIRAGEIKRILDQQSKR